MNLNGGLYHKFSHIYIEKECWEEAEVKRIRTFFPDAVCIPVHKYTDIFDRRRQSYSLQHASKNLILAAKRDQFLYKGSPVCQDFDEHYFYYCAPVMNCIYDCEYCWLKGMYPSGNLVVFINQDDFFAECEKKLAEHPLYLCIAYDTDLAALEPMLGYCEKWAAFTAKHDNLRIEIRTKAASYQNWENVEINDRVIWAFTLSPESVVEKYEHGTPSLDERLKAVNACIKEGRTVRLCFDPMIPVSDWKNIYARFVRKVMSYVEVKQLRDISVGTFRISVDYLKKMRLMAPDSAVVQYPYTAENGFYHLPFGLDEIMEEWMMECLEPYVGREKIYRWENE